MDYFTKSRPNLVVKRLLGRTATTIALALLLVACDSDTRTTTTTTQPPQSEADWSIQVSTAAVTVVEGEGSASVALSVTRGESAALPIEMTAEGATEADERDLTWEFSDASLSADETDTTLNVELAIGAKPLLTHERTLRISGDDRTNAPVVVTWSFSVQPTNKPDVYLIVGQSNAVGASQQGSRQSDPGEPDEPNDRIKQLNVTGNDNANFSTDADFTNEASVYNVGQPESPALDPLHEGYNFNTMSKSGTRIGFGLSFAKQALANTEARIYLVPAAWSDTGFCRRSSAGLGWNASEKDDDAFAGTLLYERALTRTRIALDQTGGVLRGILWHQGEADSDNEVCAEQYADNLKELADALRTNIEPDARGPEARGVNSDIPFVVGTMSKSGTQFPFDSTKEIVDAAHRGVAQSISVSSFVNSDDLVSPAYPCGDGGCVHFGAAAMREMGIRYYTELQALLP